jgi:hypothetical protein
MSHRTDAEKVTLRFGRQHATACGLPFVSAFEDTLSGDLARPQVRRRLRTTFPGISPKTVSPERQTNHASSSICARERRYSERYKRRYKRYLARFIGSFAYSRNG